LDAPGKDQKGSNLPTVF